MTIDFFLVAYLKQNTVHRSWVPVHFFFVAVCLCTGRIPVHLFCDCLCTVVHRLSTGSPLFVAVCIQIMRNHYQSIEWGPNGFLNKNPSCTLGVCKMLRCILWEAEVLQYTVWVMSEREIVRVRGVCDSHPAHWVPCRLATKKSLSFLTYISMATGLSVGLNRGHITARRELKVTPSYKKGVCIGFFFRINRSGGGWMDGWMQMSTKEGSRNAIRLSTYIDDSLAIRNMSAFTLCSLRQHYRQITNWKLLKCRN